MKKIIIVCLCFILIFSLWSCNTENNLSISEDKVDDKAEETISKESDEDKKVAITGIVLSNESYELVEGKSVTLSYEIFPENAEKKDISWKSLNPKIAKISNHGVVNALTAGETTITVSTPEGIYASCRIKVLPGSAYEKLNKASKLFVDDFLENYIKYFKNPDSIVIKAIEPGSGSWYVKLSCQNTFGGTTTSVYLLHKLIGVSEDNSFQSFRDYSEYDYDLINKAIAEKRK